MQGMKRALTTKPTLFLLDAASVTKLRLHRGLWTRARRTHFRNHVIPSFVGKLSDSCACFLGLGLCFLRCCPGSYERIFASPCSEDKAIVHRLVDHVCLPCKCSWHLMNHSPSGSRRRPVKPQKHAASSGTKIGKTHDRIAGACHVPCSFSFASSATQVIRLNLMQFSHNRIAGESAMLGFRYSQLIVVDWGIPSPNCAAPASAVTWSRRMGVTMSVAIVAQDPYSPHIVVACHRRHVKVRGSCPTLHNGSENVVCGAVPPFRHAAFAAALLRVSSRNTPESNVVVW